MSQIQFKLDCLPEDIEVRGNAMASGDSAVDKKCEDRIIADLHGGNPWAWCCARVTAFIPGIDLEGTAYLGACSYASEEDFKRDGYYTEMCIEAAEELKAKIKAVRELA